MPISKGATPIAAVRKGSVAITKICKGSTTIFSSGPISWPQENGDPNFNNPAYWSGQTGNWTVTSGKAQSRTESGVTQLFRNAPLVGGPGTYTYSLTVSGWQQGSVVPYISGAGYVDVKRGSTAAVANGTVTGTIVATTTTAFALEGTNFWGDADDFTIQRVS
jgi:hypothetical protein